MVGIRLKNKDDIQMYLFGGNGRFILKSTKTNTSYEYKVKTIPKKRKGKSNPYYDENVLFLYVKTNKKFIFLGVIKIEENKYFHSKKSKLDYNHKVVKGIKWLLKQFESDEEFPNTMEFYHLGVCGCCARTLTKPNSIKLGIGPICFEKYGNKRLKKLMKLKKKLEKRLKEDNIKL